MKKTSITASKILSIAALAIVLGLSTVNIASAKDNAGYSVAVVDVQKVVESSPQINALKTEHKNKIDDLTAFVESAKADLAKQTDAAKRKTLEDGYNKELNAKKTVLDNEFVKKLSEIDKQITASIKAKSSSFDLVLAKSSVLNGGTDITNDIIKSLK